MWKLARKKCVKKAPMKIHRRKTKLAGHPFLQKVAPAMSEVVGTEILEDNIVKTFNYYL